MSDLKRYGECVSCAECCKKLRITGILSHVIGQHGSVNEARGYYSFRGIEISGINEKDDTVCFEIDIPCDRLTKEDMCGLHDQPEKKPVICHRYPTEPDDMKSCGFEWKPF